MSRLLRRYSLCCRFDLLIFCRTSVESALDHWWGGEDPLGIADDTADPGLSAYLAWQAYAQNDFSLYTVANGLGKSSDASRYRERAGYWRNIWNPNANTTLDGVGTFTGFPAPR